MPDSEFRADDQTGVVLNRRAFPRTVFSGPVLVDTQKEWYKARAIDVSAGGMRLQTERALPVGGEVELYFEIQHLSVEARAIVVRRQGNDQFALVFERAAEGERRPKIASIRPRAA